MGGPASTYWFKIPGQEVSHLFTSKNHPSLHLEQLSAAVSHKLQPSKHCLQVLSEASSHIDTGHGFMHSLFNKYLPVSQVKQSLEVPGTLQVKQVGSHKTHSQIESLAQ